MEIYIIIPAHNEEAFIGLTLESLVNQTLRPKKVVVVNDNSSDRTAEVVTSYSSKYPWIHLVDSFSSDEHLPGQKVIQAFWRGFQEIDEDYAVICKFDADLIFPSDYLETVAEAYRENPKMGIVSGVLYVKENHQWVFENIASKDHPRGPIKAYSKDCFQQINGLQTSIGWDTVDVLLARYYGFEVSTIKTLKVKHLKPTGNSYSKKSKYLQGQAMYKMRYGLFITCIAALKMSFAKKSLPIFFNYIKGYQIARKAKVEHLVTPAQGKFIRNYRWKGIISKLNPI